MGRRKLGCRPIAQIRISIGDRVERFDLEDENLIGRRSCVKRVAALHSAALDYIKRLNGSHDRDTNELGNESVNPPPGFEPGFLFPSVIGNLPGCSDRCENESKLDPWDKLFDEDRSAIFSEDVAELTSPFSQEFLNHS
jgi:hypothetical protein